MLFRRNKNEESTELDAAWEDENPKPYFAGAAAENNTGELFDADEIAGAEGSGGSAAEAAGADETPFPEPHAFDLTSDEVPTDSEAREETTDVPFDAEDSFSYDAESEEFTTDAKGFLDDSHTDFYEYGQEKHGVHDTLEQPEEAGIPESVAVSGGVGRHGTGRTSKQAKYDQMPEHQKRSRRMRRILTVVVLLLLALLAALGYFGWRLYQESRVAVEAETTEVTTEVEQAAGTEEEATDTGSASTKNTTVPNLMNLLGKTEDEAVRVLGAGATVTQDLEIVDETSPMMNRVTVVLTEEPVDTKSGVPTVYLGLDTAGKVVTAGYSAATASLGYGTLSFADVVTNEHVVERTLSEAGLNLQDGTVTLPASSSYSTFASDGKTLVKEQCAFDGSVSQGGTNYDWTSVLVYNYTAANATGNLSDTVRQVYVYVSEAESAAAALEAKAEVLAERKAAEDAKAEEEVKAAAEEAAAAEEEANAEEEAKAEEEASAADDATNAV